MLTAFTEDRWPLYVYGPAGVGKTCAALYAADRCADYVEYLDFAVLISDYIDAKCGRLVDERYTTLPKVSSRQYGERLATHTLVIIDDWGTRDRVSDTHYEAAKMTLEARQGLPLIVTSNLSLEAIDSLYDDRVASRLAAGVVCEVQGEDQRLRRP